MAETEQVFGAAALTARGEAGKLDASEDGTKLAFTNTNSVIVRDVKSGLCDIYADHKYPVKVARFSPNGAYIASGDEGGKVHYTAYKKDGTFMLKKETPVLGGEIMDLSFDSEGKRLAVCGNGGKSNQAKVFTADSGSGLGEVAFHAKPVISIDYRPTRPFRVATGSQDFKVGLFNGPPFKFNKSRDAHTNFVQCVRFSKDGALLASTSSDKKIVIYTGDEAEIKLELPVEHKGSIFGCAWNKNNNLLTCSGDKTVKIWDVEAGKCVTTFDLGTKSFLSMQVACVYAGDLPISMSLGGDLAYLDPNTGKETKVVQSFVGLPSKVVCDWGIDGDDEQSIILGSSTGWTCSFNRKGAGKRIEGPGHDGNITDVAVNHGKGYSVGYDDSVRVSNLKSGEFESTVVGTTGQPHSIGVSNDDLVVTCTTKSVQLIKDGKILSTFETEKYDPTCVAISPDSKFVAVGCKDKVCRILSVAGDNLEDTGTELKGLLAACSCLAFSPDNTKLAIGESGKEVTLWEVGSWEKLIQGKWVFHQSTITDLSFTQDSKYLASGSIDSNIFIWNPAKPMKKLKIKLAHLGGVTTVAFDKDNSLYSSGRDFALKKWKISKFPGE